MSALSSDYIASLTDSVDIHEWTLSVVDQDLRHLARHPHNDNLLGKKIADPAFSAWLIQRDNSAFRGSALGEKGPYLWRSHQIGNLDLYVVAGTNVDRELAPWRREAGIHIVVASLLLAGCISLIAMQRRRERLDAEALALDQRLRQSEREVQELVHLVPVGVFRMLYKKGTEPRLTYASPRCHDILGRDPTTACTLSNLSTCIHPDDVVSFMMAIEQASHADSGKFFWSGRMTVDTQTRWLSIHATSSLGPYGVTQWAGIVQDVSQQREAQDALRRQEDLTRLVFDNAPLGIMLTSPDLQRIIFANKAACSMLGLAREDLVGKNLLTCIHPDDTDHVWQMLTKAMMPGHPPERFSHRAMTPQGKALELEIIATGVVDERGRPANGLILQRDITEERRLEQQLRQSEKMQAIGMLAGGIAHDFNNILACITGFADLARRRRHPDDSGIANYLEQIAGAADRAKTLVQQILSFSRRDAGERLPVHLQSNVREVMNLLRASIPSSVDIEVSIQQDVGPVMADPGRIHQLLMNLCTNAVHAMTGKGHLEVTLTQVELKHAINGHMGEIKPGFYACLSISDSGCGMDSATLEHIFEPFFTTKGNEGTGLGLAVVWNVIETHGGNLQVESTLGRGTTFRVYLPIIAKTPVEELAHGTNDLPHGSEHVLVVDDEPVLRMLYEDIFTDLGYQVTCCANGIEAMTLLQKNPAQIDLVITDQTMPGMTGGELTKAILALRPDLPIVLCSGYSNEIPDETAAKALGVRYYCTKPVNLDHLTKAIRRILDRTM